MGNGPKKLTPGASSNDVPPGSSAEVDLKVKFTPPSSPGSPKPGQSNSRQEIDFLGFANRESELEDFVLHPKGRYYLFDAPAGYGKTRLLKHICEVMEVEKGFRCVYVDVSEHSSIRNLSTTIAQGLLGTALDAALLRTRGVGLALGTAIAKFLTDNPGPKGICLLFDVDHAPDDSTLRLLREIVEEFLPVVFDNYQHNSPIAGGRKPGFQVAVAGRYLNSVFLNRFTNPRAKYVYRPLKPFDIKAVEDLVERIVGPDLDHLSDYDTKTAICAEFAANLLYFSGGHPGCIAVILQEYRGSTISPQHFFEEFQHVIQEIVRPIAEKVRESIAPDLRNTVEALCFYRHLNASLLNHLIENNSIVWSSDGFHLMKELTVASLAGWLNKFRRVIHDDILFNMLIRLHSLENKTNMESNYGEAKANCERELERAYEDRCLWAIDIWYCYLAAKTPSIQDVDRRQSLRNEFFNKELEPVLEKLLVGLDPHAERESLLGVLEEDAEFQFLLNYSLRNTSFTNEPYTIMLKTIEAFFERAIGR